ncbi:MAG: hypothetical protein ACK5RL_05830 [Acidimicrobiales bacterium]
MMTSAAPRRSSTSPGGYQAWDGLYYKWPPPSGWHQAQDGRWWPEGRGPIVPAPPATSAPRLAPSPDGTDPDHEATTANSDADEEGRDHDRPPAPPAPPSRSAPILDLTTPGDSAPGDRPEIEEPTTPGEQPGPDNRPEIVVLRQTQSSRRGRVLGLHRTDHTGSPTLVDPADAQPTSTPPPTPDQPQAAVAPAPSPGGGIGPPLVSSEIGPPAPLPGSAVSHNPRPWYQKKRWWLVAAIALFLAIGMLSDDTADGTDPGPPAPSGQSAPTVHPGAAPAALLTGDATV